MTITRGLAVLAVGLAGLAVMGAEPAPMPPLPMPPLPMPPLPVTPLSRDAVMAKLLPTPRLFKMEITQGVPPRSETTLMCMGAETLRANLSGAEARRQAAGAAAAASTKGCTLSRSTTADGWTRMDRVCDTAAGAARTSHMTNDFRSGMSEFRTHMEMQTETGGTPRTVVMETHMTMLGDCPADLKPGQVRRPNGQVVEFGGGLSAAARPPTAKP